MSSSEPVGRRVRHEVKLRMLQVIRANPITPSMIRVTLSGDELPGFTTAAHDDHVKLFFPAAGSNQLVLPRLGPDGPVFTEGAQRPAARDYTPRRYDPIANELDIDFVLHGDGPASSWAADAQPGQFLGVGGPRGSYVLSDEFDWYLLLGDETAIPAIDRRLRELPARSHAIVIVEVADSAGEHRFESMARVETMWLHRGAAAPRHNRFAMQSGRRCSASIGKRLCLGRWRIRDRPGDPPHADRQPRACEGAHQSSGLLEARHLRDPRDTQRLTRSEPRTVRSWAEVARNRGDTRRRVSGRGGG